MQIILNDPTQAHHAISKAWLDIKNNLVAGRKQILEIVDFEESVTDKQRRYLHGYIFTEISKQAVVNGNKYSMQTWAEHFKKTFIAKKRVKTINPLTGRKSTTLKRISSEDLGVKAYNELIERVTAYATTELGVNFYEDIDQWTEQNGAIR